MAWRAAFFGGGTRRGAGEVGQAGEVAFLQHQRVGFLVGQHVLAELGAEARQPLVDGRQPVLGRLVERSAGPHEAGVIAVEHAGLLGGQTERITLAVKLGDAGVERPVEIECVAMARQERRNIPLDRLDGVGGVGPGQHEEHI